MNNYTKRLNLWFSKYRSQCHIHRKVSYLRMHVECIWLATQTTRGGKNNQIQLNKERLFFFFFYRETRWPGWNRIIHSIDLAFQCYLFFRSWTWASPGSSCPLWTPRHYPYYQSSKSWSTAVEPCSPLLPTLTLNCYIFLHFSVLLI